MTTPPSSSLAAHLRAALTAAFLLALCQVVVEAVLIALRFQPYLLSPQVFFGSQMYDFSLKLFLFLPGAAESLQGGVLDRFAAAGFWPKLSVAGAMILPNVLVALAAGLLLGGARKLVGASPRVLPALWILVGVGFAVHLLSWLLAIYIPSAWSVKVLVRQAGRVFVWEGTYVSLLVLAFAGGLAAAMASLRPIARWGAFAALSALLVAGLFGLSSANTDPASAAAPAASLPPAAGERLADNLVFISIDSLRADRLGSYGNEHDTSPTIDRLARAGVRFSNAMSTTSWTTPSHMSMFTGREVLAHGVITERDALSPAIPTLAEALQAEGIATAGIVSAPQVGSPYGFGRGFDSYDDHTIPSPTAFDALEDEPAPTVEKLATSWLRENAGRRFFLFLHFWDVHYDYIPPPPYDTMFDPDYEGTVNGRGFFSNRAINKNMDRRDLEHILALYDGEIRWVDDHIGRILAVLEELGIAERTAVIVTSDHGDEFFEHGFKGHGRTLYNEVTRVPLVMRVPGVTGGRVADEPVSLADVMPTALGLMGVPSPAGMNGVDLLHDEAALAERSGAIGWLCSLKQRTNCMAMQHGREGTFIHLFQPLRVEFYAADDVVQKNDLARGGGWPRERQMTQLASRLNAGWRAFRQSGGRRGELELDAATRDRLRDLGYTD